MHSQSASKFRVGGGQLGDQCNPTGVGTGPMRARASVGLVASGQAELQARKAGTQRPPMDHFCNAFERVAQVLLGLGGFRTELSRPPKACQ